MVQLRIRLQEYLLCGLLATYFETALCVGRSNDYNVLCQGFLVQEDFMPDSGVDVNYMMDEPVPHEGLWREKNCLSFRLDVDQYRMAAAIRSNLTHRAQKLTNTFR